MIVAASVGAGVLFSRFIWLLLRNGWTVRPWVILVIPFAATLLCALLLTASAAGVILSLALLEAATGLLDLLDLVKDWFMIRNQLAGRRSR